MPKIAIQAALLAALLPVPALATEAPPEVRVSYVDLDLARAADVRRLDRRLARAAAAVCPSADGVREMSQLRTIALCRKARQAEIAPLRASALAAAIGKTTFATAR